MDRQGRNAPLPEAAPGRRLLAIILTGAAQLALFGVLFLPVQQRPQPKEPTPPLQVSLLPAPRPPAPAEGEENGLPAIARPPPPAISAPVFTIAAVPDSSDLLSDSQLAGAMRAGEGSNGGGGSCDMAEAVQQALRRDRLVADSMASAQRLGKAMLLWNGDWVRSGGEDGKGLSAVREAVMWEVGFAPRACREQPMHGLVVLSLADGRTRFAIGAGAWRWSDLLGVKSPAVR